MLNHVSLITVLGLMYCFLPKFAQADDTFPSVPAHLKTIKSHSIQKVSVPSEKLLSAQKHGANYRFFLNLNQASIDIGVDEVTQNKGGTRSFSASFKTDDKDWTLIYTQGNNSGFGELFGNGQHLLIEQRGEQVIAVDLGLSGLTPGLYENDVVGERKIFLASAKNLNHIAINDDVVVVDVMLLFTQNIVDTFPGDMTQTLMEYLVFKANQTFFDSRINMRLRLVHTQFIDYPNPSSIVALNELRNAVDDDPNTITDPSLGSIATLRNSFGADIVSMIRTHDLNEREVCGIAMFPNSDVDYLVNVSNVGISGGSNCLDTFTHEIGHNFGAGHQRVNGSSQGAEPAAGALIVPGKFNTMMSSIGTGDINRDFGLAVFSNPDVTCAGVSCGDAIVANNTATINNFAQINAALRVAINESEVPSLLPSVNDRDGDTVFDVNDVFPFDPTESLDSDLDGVGDNQDAFPNDFNEQQDTDLDGIGNNADNDDDNDGTDDFADALPLDPSETVDVDADGVGGNADQLDNNFQETKDNDQDGIGDRKDLDDDNDGVPDYFAPSSLLETEAWVVSAGSDNVLRYNSQTGTFIASLLAVPTGGFSFRSDAILSNAQQLFFIAFSDVLAFDRQTNTIRRVIDRSLLSTNFPAHLGFQDNTTLLVNNGLGTSNIELFSLLASGNHPGDATSDSAVWRDFVVNGNRLIIAERNTNRLLSFSLDNLTAAPQVLSTQGLNKPEHLAVDSNANIYVTNAGSKDLSQFDSSGNFLGKIISAGSGGLGQPGCLTIGPEGNIYICSTDTDQVLKYDGVSGDFLNVFVEAAAGGLNQPVSLVFAGLPQDEFRLHGEHDSDGDLVNNLEDAFPLDATESVDTDNDGTGNNADTDDDNDNLPDTYETANHLDPLDGSDAQQDADNDGSSNIAEFEAGSDPNDPNSTPVTPETRVGGGSIGLSWMLLVLTLVLMRRRKMLSRVNE
ncbi:M12 family metallo-peptidase [Paraglaciecola sp. MB-3u-78]|uniref:M12 family metallo-peptidase n=1 Tax=Paraglaciecola sp. MB-3u-78 TaxID=2058332 RepID=UPI0018E3DF34|nr:M12 family metallo-peptidase [Paraglaciecola sp. MB-3u-78]